MKLRVLCALVAVVFAGTAPRVVHPLAAQTRATATNVKELLFAALDGTVMSVDVTPGATFQASAPKALFKVDSGILPNWDVTADGKRFLVLLRVQQSAQAPFTVVLNWRAGIPKQ